MRLFLYAIKQQLCFFGDGENVPTVGFACGCEIGVVCRIVCLCAEFDGYANACACINVCFDREFESVGSADVEDDFCRCFEDFVDERFGTCFVFCFLKCFSDRKVFFSLQFGFENVIGLACVCFECFCCGKFFVGYKSFVSAFFFCCGKFCIRNERRCSDIVVFAACDSESLGDVSEPVVVV